MKRILSTLLVLLMLAGMMLPASAYGTTTTSSESVYSYTGSQIGSFFVLLIIAVGAVVCAAWSFSSERTAKKEQQEATLKIDFAVKRTRQECQDKYNEQLEECKVDCNKQLSRFKEEYNQQYIEYVNTLFSEKIQSYPWMAQQFADFLYVYDLVTAQDLERKRPPALKGAEEVRRINREKRDLQKQLKAAQYQLNYYETLFPWLEEFKELDATEGADIVFGTGDDDEYTSLRDWLSPEEYQKLPNVEKFQLALDRYMNSTKKTKWRAGLDYERYVGYLFEQHGYTVEYIGALKGLEDMGRDLVARNGDAVVIMQCKRWSQEKTIHEKHIFQLYGTSVLYKMKNNCDNITCNFVTTTELSETAAQCAKFLDVAVLRLPLEKYPVIKCHISNGGEKIYHLPFDQQYDKIKNNHDGRLLYASTVKEAEDMGYRRAFRWHGEKQG